MSTPKLGRTIILGNSGFIGQALHAGLARDGVEVHGYSSRQLDLRNPESLTTLDELAGPDATLIFASALAPPRGNTLEGLADNLTMVINVARYLESHPVRQCIYFSSDAVYGFGTDPVSEETPVAPSGFYALGKYTGEEILRTVAAARDLPLLVLRPTGVYGPGDTHNSYGPNRFARGVVQERSVRLFGEGEETRDHLYVDDLVRLTLALAAARATGTLNLATGTSRTFGSIVDALRRLVSDDFEVVHAPRAGAVTHRQFDVSRLTAAMPGFEFTPFEAGLAATVAAAKVSPG
jgi:UDP-glucose 4-epimerase